MSNFKFYTCIGVLTTAGLVFYGVSHTRKTDSAEGQSALVTFDKIQQRMLSAKNEENLFEFGAKSRSAEVGSKTFSEFSTLLKKSSSDTVFNPEIFYAAVTENPEDSMALIVNNIDKFKDRHWLVCLAARAVAVLKGDEERTNAMDSVRRIGNLKIKDELISGIAEYLGYTADPLGYELALELSDEKESERVSGVVLGSWVAAKPTDGSMIAEQLSLDKPDEAVVAFFRNWVYADIDTAVGYLSRIADSPEKNQIIVELSGSYVQMKADPETALTWAALLDDKNAERPVKRIFNSVENADMLLENSMISQEDKNRFLMILRAMRETNKPLEENK